MSDEVDGERTEQLRTELARFATREAPALPLPGRGDTPARFAAFAELGRRDLSLVRLAEAHADALAIATDLDRADDLPDEATFGVWAARSRTEVVEATREDGGWRLRGDKPWCTGVGLVSHALVTAEADAGPLLFVVAVDDPGVRVAARPWTASAFGATGTATLHLDVHLPDRDRLGEPGAYLARTGFWHGASGVAACWAGGLVGCVDRAAPWWRGDPHAAAHRGAVDADAWAVRQVLEAAGREADARPDDVGAAHRTALRVRHLVDAAVARTLTHVRRGCGPAPFAFDAGVGGHAAELELYVRQCHAERDLEALGALIDHGGGRHHDG